MTSSIPSFEAEGSISVLAQLAMEHSGAIGYALYALDPESGALLVRYSFGESIPRPQELVQSAGVARQHGRAVICYSLRHDGTLLGKLAFAFQGDSITDDRIALLDRMARVVESVYCLPRSAELLFEKVNRLEVQVTASKIAARVQGILGGAIPSEVPEQIDLPGKIDLIHRQVEQTVRSWRLTPLLEDLLKNAEQRISERKLTTQAKALIQAAYGLTEEQAYSHLRNTSRRTRRTLAQVAQDFISGPGFDDEKMKRSA